jgi:hypothetical protein
MSYELLNIKDMKRIYFCLLIMFLCYSCTEKEIAPISGSSGKPAQVDILDTVVIPGGVIVNYKIPPINDIIEIKAVYTLSNGQKRESSTSLYTSFMTIDGYNDTDEHEAEIYTINRAREMSDPVNFKFRPGESPLTKTTNSMQIVRDFGGAKFIWANPDKAMLTLEFYTENEYGEMVTIDIMSSQTDSMDMSFRGYDTIPRKFAVNIHDNFGNSSGMIYPEGETIIPIYEAQFDKKIQRVMATVSGDVSWDLWEGRAAHLIDDDLLTIIHSDNNTVPGASFTLDIGKKAKISRIVVFQRQQSNTVIYASGNFEIFEIYSSDEEGDEPNGDWSAWTLQKVCNIVKPSGASAGQVTSEDIAQVKLGHDFSMPLDMPPVRYLRFKALKVWESGVTYSYISELAAYGTYVE